MNAFAPPTKNDFYYYIIILSLLSSLGFPCEWDSFNFLSCLLSWLTTLTFSHACFQITNCLLQRNMPLFSTSLKATWVLVTDCLDSLIFLTCEENYWCLNGSHSSHVQNLTCNAILSKTLVEYIFNKVTDFFKVIFF